MLSIQENHASSTRKREGHPFVVAPHHPTTPGAPAGHRRPRREARRPRMPRPTRRSLELGGLERRGTGGGDSSVQSESSESSFKEVCMKNIRTESSQSIVNSLWLKFTGFTSGYLDRTVHKCATCVPFHVLSSIKPAKRYTCCIVRKRIA